MPLVSRMVSKLEINHERTGARMRELRKSREISLRSIATEMGYSPPYICDIELGRRNWTKELARKYEAALQSIKNRGFAKAPPSNV